MGWREIGFESYQDYLNSNIWQSTQEVMLREYEHCYFCKTTENLRVHHTQKGYERIPQEKSTDLIVCCLRCHKKIHRGENGIKQKNKREF